MFYSHQNSGKKNARFKNVLLKNWNGKRNARMYRAMKYIYIYGYVYVQSGKSTKNKRNERTNERIESWLSVKITEWNANHDKLKMH